MYILLLLLSISCLKVPSDEELIKKYNLEKGSDEGEVLKFKNNSQAEEFLKKLKSLKDQPNKQYEIITKGETFEFVAERGIGLNIQVGDKSYGYLKAVLTGIVETERNPEGVIYIKDCKHSMGLVGVPLGTSLENVLTWHEINGNKVKIFGKGIVKSKLIIGEIYTYSEEIKLVIEKELN